MQDNNRIDEQFIDQAWANMSHMLDQEMPIQGKKKRRFALIWLLLPFLVIGSIVFYWQFLGTEESIEPSYFEIPTRGNEPTQNITPIAELEIDNTLPPINNSDASSSDESQMREKTFSPIATMDNSENESITKEPKEFVVQETTSTVEEIMPPQMTEGSSNFSFVPMALLSPIPTLSISAKNDVIPVVVLNKNEIKQPKNNFNFGLEVGGRAGNGLAFGGAYGGAFVDYKLSNRWSISSGLALDWQRVSFENRPTSFDESDFQSHGGFEPEDSMDVEVTTGGNSTDFSQYEIGDVDVNFLANILQLELPLHVQYQISPKWKLIGGGYLNYVVTAIEEENVFAERQELSTGNASPLTLFKESGVDEKILNRWNYGVEVGALYQVSKKWQISMDASLGLKDWLTEGENTRRNSVQIGLRYQFR